MFSPLHFVLTCLVALFASKSLHHPKKVLPSASPSPLIEAASPFKRERFANKSRRLSQEASSACFDLPIAIPTQNIILEGLAPNSILFIPIPYTTYFVPLQGGAPTLQIFKNGSTTLPPSFTETPSPYGLQVSPSEAILGINLFAVIANNSCGQALQFLKIKTEAKNPISTKFDDKGIFDNKYCQQIYTTTYVYTGILSVALLVFIISLTLLTIGMKREAKNRANIRKVMEMASTQKRK